MLKTVELKLYLKPQDIECLERWLRVCCWIYNKALEYRIKSWKRRKVSATLYDQYRLLTIWRSRMAWLKEVPANFARFPLRRVDFGFKSFFRRVKAGVKPGFPRFKSCTRYRTLEFLLQGNYFQSGFVRIPKLGAIRARGPFVPAGKQKILRIIKRPSGWYANIVVDQDAIVSVPSPKNKAVGLDVGILSFATLSTGESFKNPNWSDLFENKVKALNRRISRREKGSNRWKKAVRSLARLHEKISSWRKNFCHKLSTKLVKENGVIVVEKLNIRGLAASRLSKAVTNCGWSIFTTQLAYKAEWAGRKLVKVDPRNTSRECPNCGLIKEKKLSQRVHACQCGLTLDRDHAAAKIILKRGLDALEMAGAERPWRVGAVGPPCETGSPS